ncbi:PREDICTED: uncharacterized protein LOC109487235 [Branchiostoma belcheri]|uniref:Uncharacterized protein LOC109487235 n=1 Tax=Branchiostoma belcheri TaxID=7741 RepID=A0A6P5A0A5_BRABE|nr:PREDICTED: uncharacterized protein LOC109487235 [Branchiostoma belcheri]
MASALTPDLSLSTIQSEGTPGATPEGTPDVTPSVSRQSSRLAGNGEESASRRPSKVMFTSTPKSERAASSEQIRRDSSVLSTQRDSSVLSDRRDSSDQLRRDSGMLSDRQALRRDSSAHSDRRDSNVLSNRDQLGRDSSGQLPRDSSMLSTSDQLRRNSSALSDRDQLGRDISGQLPRDSSAPPGRDSSVLSDRRDNRVLSDHDQLRRDSSAQLGRDSSAQLRRDSSALSDRYPSTLCTDDLEPWDSLPKGYVTSSSSGLLSPQKSQEKGDALTPESTPASSRVFATSPRRSQDSLATRDFPSMPSLQPQASHQSRDDGATLGKVSSGPSELTSKAKSSDVDASLGNGSWPASSTKLFSEPSRESASSNQGRAQGPSVGTSEVLSLRRSYESSAEASGASRSTSKTSTTRESASSLGGVRRIATTVTRGSGPSGSELSADDSEILRRLTKMNERMCSENDLLKDQLKLFKRNAELKQISLISLVIAWHQGLLSPDDCRSLSELSQLGSEDDPGGFTVSGRGLGSSVREIKRVLHHLERSLIDLDLTVRDHQSLWRDARRLGAFPPLPASCSQEGASAPRLYIPRPHAEHSGTAVQLANKETTQPDDSGLGGSLSKMASFTGGEETMDGRARRSSEAHDVREVRLLGEVCHQLEQRVLVSVFPRQKIDHASFSLRTIGDLVRLEPDPDEKEFLTRKLGRVTATLRLYGFDPQRHPFFMTDILLRFGRFGTDWDKYSFVQQKGYHDAELLRETVGRLVPDTFRRDMLVVLDCLLVMLPRLPVLFYLPGYHDAELLRETVGRLVPDTFRHDMLVVLDCLLAMAREDGCSIFLW